MAKKVIKQTLNKAQVINISWVDEWHHSLLNHHFFIFTFQFAFGCNVEIEQFNYQDRENLVGVFSLTLERVTLTGLPLLLSFMLSKDNHLQIALTHRNERGVNLFISL